MKTSYYYFQVITGYSAGPFEMQNDKFQEPAWACVQATNGYEARKAWRHQPTQDAWDSCVEAMKDLGCFDGSKKPSLFTDRDVAALHRRCKARLNATAAQ